MSPPASEPAIPKALAVSCVDIRISHAHAAAAPNGPVRPGAWKPIFSGGRRAAGGGSAGRGVAGGGGGGGVAGSSVDWGGVSFAPMERAWWVPQPAVVICPGARRDTRRGTFSRRNDELRRALSGQPPEGR